MLLVLFCPSIELSFMPVYRPQHTLHPQFLPICIQNCCVAVLFSTMFRFLFYVLSSLVYHTLLLSYEHIPAHLLSVLYHQYVFMIQCEILYHQYVFMIQCEISYHKHVFMIQYEVYCIINKCNYVKLGLSSYFYTQDTVRVIVTGRIFICYGGLAKPWMGLIICHHF